MKSQICILFMLLVLTVSTTSAQSTTYFVTMRVNRGPCAQELIWNAILMIESTNETVTIKILKALYNIVAIFENETFATPFSIVNVEDNASLRIESEPSGLNVIFKSTLSSDATKDGKVDYVDLFVFAKAYESWLGDPKYNGWADFKMDGQIDGYDFLLLEQDWLKSLT